MRFRSLLASCSLAVALCFGFRSLPAVAQPTTPLPSPASTSLATQAPLAPSPSAAPTADPFAAIFALRAGHGATTRTFGGLLDLLRTSRAPYGVAGGASGATAVICFHADRTSSARTAPTPEATGEKILADCGDRPNMLAYLPIAAVRSVAPHVALVPLRDTAWSELGRRLGFDLPHLLATLKRDPLFDAKAITKGADGTLFMVTATSHDPPNSRYDHGFRTTIHHLYLFRDGRVAAVFLQYFEN